jgi:glycosyltransferase involved in cell wall biosynthesis
VDEFLQQCDILVVPYSNEPGFSRVIVDGWSVGVPVVVMKSGASPELLRDGVNGLLFEENSATDLAKKVNDLLESESKSAFFVHNGYKELPSLQREICGDKWLGILHKMRKANNE